jgi:hypothetical protein
MKLPNDKISRRILPAVFVAAGLITAMGVHAEALNQSGVTPTFVPESPPLCGVDLRGRVALIQFEDGATYVLAEPSVPVSQRAGSGDSWEADHLNSGN